MNTQKITAKVKYSCVIESLKCIQNKEYFTKEMEFSGEVAVAMAHDYTPHGYALMIAKAISRDRLIEINNKTLDVLDSYDSSYGNCFSLATSGGTICGKLTLIVDYKDNSQWLDELQSKHVFDYDSGKELLECIFRSYEA